MNDEFIRNDRNKKRFKPLVPNILVLKGKNSDIKEIDELLGKICHDTEPSIINDIQLYKSSAANFILTDISGTISDLLVDIESIEQKIEKHGEKFAKFFPIDAQWVCMDIPEVSAGCEMSNSDRTSVLVKVSPDLAEDDKMEKEENVKDTLGKCARGRVLFFSFVDNGLIRKLLDRTGADIEDAFKLGCGEDDIEQWRKQWTDLYQNFPVPKSELESEADSFIYWAAGRAAAIATVPLPLADVGPLIANEIYMITRLASLYGIEIDKAVITMIISCCGASFLGRLGASFLPILKIPIAAAITYGVGQAAKAYFASGMKLTEQEIRSISERETKKYKDESDAKK